MSITVRAHDDLAAGESPQLLVRTAALRAVLLEFIDDWNAQRPAGRRSGYDRQGSQHDFVSAVTFLSMHSGVPESTIEKIVGRSPRESTLLQTADALVSSIGRPDFFYDGEPPTLPVLCRRGGELRPVAD